MGFDPPHPHQNALIRRPEQSANICHPSPHPQQAGTSGGGGVTSGGNARRENARAGPRAGRPARAGPRDQLAVTITSRSTMVGELPVAVYTHPPWFTIWMVLVVP